MSETEGHPYRTATTDVRPRERRAAMVLVGVLVGMVLGLFVACGVELGRPSSGPPAACAERAAWTSDAPDCAPGQRIEVVRDSAGGIGGWVCRCPVVVGLDAGSAR